MICKFKPLNVAYKFLHILAPACFCSFISHSLLQCTRTCVCTHTHTHAFKYSNIHKCALSCPLLSPPQIFSTPFPLSPLYFLHRVHSTKTLFTCNSPSSGLDFIHSSSLSLDHLLLQNDPRPSKKKLQNFFLCPWLITVSCLALIRILITLFHILPKCSPVCCLMTS